MAAEVASTKVPKAEKHFLRALAEEKGTSVSGYLRDLVREQIKERFGAQSPTAAP